jgi:hypothetical protein
MVLLTIPIHETVCKILWKWCAEVWKSSEEQARESIECCKTELTGEFANAANKKTKLIRFQMERSTLLATGIEAILVLSQ